MPLKALIPLADGFEDVEAVAAIDILRRADVEVTVAGLKPGLITGARRTTLHPDALLEKAAGALYDALVLPGGARGAQNLAASPLVRELVKKHAAAGRLVAAICAAPAVVLAPLGVLDGRTATCFPGMEAQLGASVKHSTEAVVLDGHLLTSRAMGTAVAFSLAIVEKLRGKDAAERIRQSILA